MSYSNLRDVRRAMGLTQVQAAARLGVSQPYLSQLERGQRKTTPRLAWRAARLYRLPPTALPPPGEVGGDAASRLPHQLAALDYPGYSHLRPSPPVNPAVVVLEALSESGLDARVAEALPWVLVRYPELDWGWLLPRVKARDAQNRLGFLVTVAAELAESTSEWMASSGRLRQVEQDLEKSRLVAETTLTRDSMPSAERSWLRDHRPPEAVRWNVLSTMNATQLPYAA
jgi:transcriptional regulator with XRE-family HTH domain